MSRKGAAKLNCALQKFKNVSKHARRLPRAGKMWDNRPWDKAGRKPGKEMMLRTSIVAIALLVAAAASTQAQQLPPQPPPVSGQPGQGNAEERAACRPDVTKLCQTQLEVNPNDVLGILGCLQANRSKLSHACEEVLASHGQ